MYRAIICYQAVRMQGSGEVEMKQWRKKTVKWKGASDQFKFEKKVFARLLYMSMVFCVSSEN